MPRDNTGAYVRPFTFTGDALGPSFVEMSPQRFDQAMDDMASAITDTPTAASFATLQTTVTQKVDRSQITAWALTLLDDVSVTAARVTLGLGTMATAAADDYVPRAGNVTMTGPLTGTTFRANLGVELGDTANVLANPWTLSLVSGEARLTAPGGVQMLAISTSQQSVYTGSGLRQIWHSGNLSPVKTINGNAPDGAGNIALTTSNTWPGGTDVTSAGVINTGVVTNAKRANMPAKTVSANLNTVSGAPQDVTLAALQEAMILDGGAFEKTKVACIRPLLPLITTSPAQVRAYPTFAAGSTAQLELYASVNGGAYFLAASGPNNAELTYTYTNTNSYKFFTRVTLGDIDGPQSEIATFAPGTGVGIGGGGDFGGA